MQVYVSGNYAYITDDANKLHIVDISIPTTPIETGTLQMTSPPGTSYYIKGNNIYVKGNYAYVTIPFPATGLVIVDISNPESPTIAGIYESGSEFYEVSVIDNYAYVADKSNGLQIIDVSDPTNTAQAGYYYNFTELNFSACVCTDANHAFLGTQNGLFIFEDDLISNVNPSYNSSSILEIYPNPTNDYISIQFNDDYSDISNICIYDGMGKIIFTSQLKDNKYLINNRFDIDISTLTPSVYFIRVSAVDSNKTTVKSFVKY